MCLRLVPIGNLEVNIVKVVFLSVLTVKFWPWVLQKFHSGGTTWGSPSNTLYTLRELRDRVCLRFVGFK